MRAAHSLKGAARIVGVDAAVQVAHALEDAFVAAQNGTVTLGPPHGDVLLRAVDLLGQIAQLPDDQLSTWQAQHEPAVAAMVADLKAILNGPPLRPLWLRSLSNRHRPKIRRLYHHPSLPPTTPATAAETAERVVRVSAESLSRLLGLAGESLIQSRQLRPLVERCGTSGVARLA